MEFTWAIIGPSKWRFLSMPFIRGLGRVERVWIWSRKWVLLPTRSAEESVFDLDHLQLYQTRTHCCSENVQESGSSLEVNVALSPLQLTRSNKALFRAPFIPRTRWTTTMHIVDSFFPHGKLKTSSTCRKLRDPFSFRCDETIVGIVHLQNFQKIMSDLFASVLSRG